MATTILGQAQRVKPIAQPVHGRVMDAGQRSGTRGAAQHQGGDGNNQHRGDRVGAQQVLHRRQQRPGLAVHRLGTGPDLIPLAAARDVERHQQRRPGGKAAQAFRDHLPARPVTEPARQVGINRVDADEGEIDQRRHPQAHVIEPDQHPQPVVGHQPQEQLQAPGAVVAGRLHELLHGSQRRAHGAVLVVPGRVRRQAQEGRDDRRHPQAPAQHPHRLGADLGQPGAAEGGADRPQAPLDQRRQQHQVQAEQGRGKRPLHHARQRLGIEQLHAARDQAKIGRSPLAEQRVNDELVAAAPGLRVVHRRVAGEAVQHHLPLAGVEIPGDQPAGDAAHGRLQQVHRRPLRTLPQPAADGGGVQQQARPGIDHRPTQRPGGKTHAIAAAGQAERKPQRHRQPRQDSARQVVRLPVGGGEPVGQRRAAVEGLDHGARQRKQHRAKQRAAQQRPAGDPARCRASAQGRAAVYQHHEPDAVDGALAGAAAPVVGRRLPGRAPALERVQQRAGDQKGLAPQAGLCQRGAGHHQRQLLPAGQAGGKRAAAKVGQVGRQRRPQRAAPQQGMQAPAARPALVHRQAQAQQRELAKQPQHQPVAQQPPCGCG